MTLDPNGNLQMYRCKPHRTNLFYCGIGYVDTKDDRLHYGIGSISMKHTPIEQWKDTYKKFVKYIDSMKVTD